MKRLDPDWLDDHAEEACAHLKEARAEIDARHPRRGAQQALWLASQRLASPGFYRRWVHVHYLWWELERVCAKN
jgi:hypothetical protein